MSDETIGFIILAVIAVATFVLYAPMFWHSAADRRSEREERLRDQREGRKPEMRDDAPINY